MELRIALCYIGVFSLTVENNHLLSSDIRRTDKSYLSLWLGWEAKPVYYRPHQQAGLNELAAPSHTKLDVKHMEVIKNIGIPGIPDIPAAFCAG